MIEELTRKREQQKQQFGDKSKERKRKEKEKGKERGKSSLSNIFLLQGTFFFKKRNGSLEEKGIAMVELREGGGGIEMGKRGNFSFVLSFFLSFFRVSFSFPFFLFSYLHCLGWKTVKEFHTCEEEKMLCLPAAYALAKSFASDRSDQIICGRKKLGQCLLLLCKQIPRSWIWQIKREKRAHLMNHYNGNHWVEYYMPNCIKVSSYFRLGFQD